MRILAFAASLRTGSLNAKLIELVAQHARAQGAEVDVAAFSDFDAPLYNADLQQESGFPPGVEDFKQRLDAADALILASPEYNYSLPGNLKNLIDWASRYRPTQPFRDRRGLLLSASGSMVGGIRGLWQLRIPLEGLGMHVYPDMFALAQAHKAFADDGSLSDEKLQQRLDDLLRAFIAQGPVVTTTSGHL